MNDKPAKLGRLGTLALTTAIKVVGLASAFNQLLLKGHPGSLALGVSAFMMAGAQLSEGLILAIIDRFMELPPPSEDKHEARPRGD